jgi:hypothetical protein
MFKKLFIIIISSLIIIFFYLVTSKYLSENNKKKINNNRINISKKIKDKASNLPVLKNDTDNIIEFNSGFSINNNKKKKRKFWELIKIN